MSTDREKLQTLLSAPLHHTALQEEPLKTVLRNVQGNILHGHGRNFAAHTFLQFQNGQEEKIKQWLREYIICEARSAPDQLVTSAQDQLDERKKYRRSKDRQALFMSCMLSAKGYIFLKGPGSIEGFSAEFQGGMKEAQGRLKDPSYPSWREVHAMILLAHHDKDRLQYEQKNRIDDHIKTLAAHHWVEWGNVLHKDGLPDGPRVEHFGYVDGYSQPLFFQQDLEKEKQERGIDQWNPGVGPHLVLTPDPLGGATDYGSYFVFRKLEQNVTRFQEQIRNFATTHEVDEEEAMALIVGRFRDGTPLALSDAPSAPQASGRVVPNNFRYDIDWDGQRCPFDTHIRRMNPRWAPGGLAYDRRIARRSIPYGIRHTDEPVGLLFMCYQQSLKTQFEALQGEWAHATRDLPSSRYDALIGHRQAAGKPAASKHWAITGRVTEQPIEDCVTLRGGEYFFAPSINVLMHL